MEYKSVPFTPAISRNKGAEETASHLELVIAKEASAGLEYVGLQNHSTIVPGTRGCFGIGAQPPYPITFSVAVFRK